MSTVGAGSNASDVGLIVQGTLIFLSAVVAVAGCEYGRVGFVDFVVFFVCPAASVRFLV
jgi:hypothetical protein